MSTRAAIYARVSRDEQRHDGSWASESPEAQLEACRRYAEHQGWEVVAEHVDRDVSGSKDVERPGFSKVERLVESGEVDHVLVWKLDRFSRRGAVYVLSQIETFKKRGVEVVSVTEALDTSTPMGEAMVGVLASVAKTEAQNISQRVASAYRRKAEQGKPHVNMERPFGYTDATRSELHPIEAPKLKEMFARILEGESYGVLARELNAEGIFTTRGNEWTSTNLSRLMHRREYAGERTYKGEVVAQGDWEALVTPEDHRRLRDLSAEHPNANRKNVYRHPFTPVLRCECGSKLNILHQTNRQGGERLRYRCKAGNGGHRSGSKGTAVEYPALVEICEEALFARLVEVQRSADTTAEGIAERTAVLQQLLNEDAEALEALAKERYVTRTLDDATYHSLRRELDQRRDASISELDRLKASADTAALLKEMPRTESELRFWWFGKIDQHLDRRRLVKLVFEKITVSTPEYRGQPMSERVDFTYNDTTAEDVRGAIGAAWVSEVESGEPVELAI